MYYYVYSPVNGEHITGLDDYCCSGCGSHSTCQYDTPVDIDTAGTTDIYFRASSSIGSIKFVFDWHCCCDDVGDDYARTVEVELYYNQDATCYIGSVLYGHLEDLNSNIWDGKEEIYNGEDILIGESMQGLNDYSCSDPCYDGAHIHLEENNGEYVGPSCGGSVFDGTSIYRYYHNAGWC